MDNKLTNVTDSSVQAKPEALRTQIVLFAQYDQYAPSWWSTARDAWLRKFWIQESFLAGAIYDITARNSAFGWELSGIDDDVAYAQDMLQAADFGRGWQSLISKVTTDLLTQDNGAFIEVIRPARVRLDGQEYSAYKMRYENDQEAWYADYHGKMLGLADKNVNIYDYPLDLPIGIAHLDSFQCQRTGDPQVPVIYTDIYGKAHKLRWWQVLDFTDMPSPIEKMNGVGYCAITRCLRAAHVAQSMSIYKDEKISGRFSRSIYLTNADADALQDAVTQANNASDGLNLLRYAQPIIAQTFNPDTTPAIAQINLAEVPDGFNENDTMNWYIAQLANALGVDYGYLAPLPGKGLGTASQSETQQRQAKGKSSRQFMDMLSNAFNFKGVLPQSVRFSFIEHDPEAEMNDEKTKQTRVETRKLMLENGEITAEIARQMAVDSGDLDKQYLELLGGNDLTPAVTVEGDDNLEAEEATIEGESEVKHYKVNPAYFAKLTLGKRIKMFFAKKQIDVPDNVQSPELRQALTLYGADLERLALRARNGEITQGEFEQQMAAMVETALITIYAEMVGKDPDEFDTTDIDELQDFIDINLESVGKIAADIYAGNYADTEDKDGALLLFMRLGLWVTNAWGLATIATIRNPQNTEKRYRFILGGTIEHCTDCLRLNNQVHTADEWNANSQWLPRSHSLECNGFNCRCYLQETDAPVSGNF